MLRYVALRNEQLRILKKVARRNSVRYQHDLAISLYRPSKDFSVVIFQRVAHVNRMRTAYAYYIICTVHDVNEGYETMPRVQRMYWNERTYGMQIRVTYSESFKRFGLAAVSFLGVKWCYMPWFSLRYTKKCALKERVHMLFGSKGLT